MISIWTLALTTTFNVNWVWWELLLERSYCLVTEIEDRKQEDFYVEEALRACGYPKRTFNKVRRQIESKRDKKTKKQRDSSQRPMVVILYVENVSEADCKNNKKAQRTCGNETIQNFKECTGTSKRQTGEGRLNRMCVQSSLCQLWQDLHRRNWKEIWSQIIGTNDWSGIQNRTHIH